MRIYIGLVICLFAGVSTIFGFGIPEKERKALKAEITAQMAEANQELMDNYVNLIGKYEQLLDTAAMIRADLNNEFLDIAVPVGTIVGWHKNSLPAGAKMPENWTVCDGQVLLDTDSPLFGEKLPDLNGEGRFLRGGDISGVMQESAIQSHSHEYTDKYQLNNGPEIWSLSGQNVLPADYDEVIRSSENEGLEETRPVNMSIIWIIRTK